MKRVSAPSESVPVSRKSYRTPALQRYGMIAEMTRTLSTAGGMDAGTGSTKTQ
jgi:hypothetical protein